MNVVFAVVFLLSALYFLLFAPNEFLPALLSGAGKAGTLSLSLLTVYCVWMGLTELMEECGINRKISKVLKPSVKKLFKVTDEEAIGYITMNLSANMLGISGAATPFGIKAANRLQELPHARVSSSMLLVINATSVQILPSTVIALLVSFQAKNPASVILPSLLASIFTTGMGILLVKIFIRKD